jgi:glycosyltransferase involved in cell wall biosynthesis
VSAVQRARGSLHEASVGIDARYLRRPGIGITSYVRQGISNLAAAGARLSLITDDAGHRAALRSEFPSASVVVLAERSGFMWEQRSLRRHLDAACYDAYVAPANYGLPLRYRGKTPLLLIVHDLIPLRLPHLYLLGRPLWATKYLLSVGIAAVRADRIVAVSDATAADITRLLRKHVADVVYPQIPAQVHEAPATQGRPYFVYNGGADVRKNVPTLLRAFSLVRDQLGGPGLVILGTGYDGLLPYIGKLGITEHVCLPGYVDEAAKDQIVRDALALVYPSRLEGFGLPVVEALAAGIPVVSGRGGALAEIGGAAPVYLDKIDTRSLAAAMIKVADGDARQRARQAAGVQLALLAERQQACTLADAVAACIAQSAASSRPDSDHTPEASTRA